MKDTLSESRLSFQNIPAYPLSKDWVIRGIFNPVQKDSSISITNKVGITYDSEFKGSLTFNYNGKQQTLLATNGGEGKLFIVMADGTTGSETYGGGRFLYVDIPENGNKVTLDFNKAQNPICAFSDFATCPLPPRENHLSFDIDAGEKKVR